MSEAVVFGILALAIVLVGWLAWPEADELDLAPKPSRLRLPGLLMLVCAAILLGSSILATSASEIEDQNMRAVQFMGGCFLWLSGIILVSAAAITDTINRRR
ncbi:MAG: hypothetical protein NTX28_10010 [Novosphingobium sp.]|nr:hypothetical protein [Novosphingobium sp.]